MSTSKRASLLVKCVAWSTAAAIPSTLYNRYRDPEQRTAQKTPRSENVTGPQTVYVDRPSLKTLGIIAGVGVASVGLVHSILLFGRIDRLRTSTNRTSLLFKCQWTAYSMAMLVPFTYHHNFIGQGKAKSPPRSEDVAAPRTVYMDRLSHFDVGGMMVTGGLIGVYIAWQFRSPRKASGWRRYATASMVGAAPPLLTFWMCKMFENVGEMIETMNNSAQPLELTIDPLSSTSELASPMDVIRSLTGLESATLVAEGLEPVAAGDGSTMAMFGRRGGSSEGSSGSGGSFQASSDSPGVPVNLEVITDGPHVAIKKGNEEPEVQPQTNYNWYSENKIADLEQHIANTRKRRVELAQEAEFVWAWLSEKEAQHLEKFPVTKKAEDGDPKPEPARAESSMFIQSLGQAHNLIWREASACDWIIADSQKRIAQEKSKTSDGKVEWHSSCSESASQSPLKQTLRTLKDTAELQAAVKNQLDQALANLAMGLGDPGADMNQMAMHPIKKKMATHREIVTDIRAHMEEQIETAGAFEKMLRKAIVEAEEKAGNGN